MATDEPDMAGPHSIEYNQLTWHPVDPTQPSGPQIAALWGDPTNGPFGALLRVPPGFESPMHTHSEDERVIQLGGRSIHWTKNESRASEQVMSFGDYMMMPAGIFHVSAAAEDEESVEFLTMEGAFDFILSENEGGRDGIA